MHHIPRKRFGQHFLKDTQVLKKMLRDINLQSTDHVIEIGPGQGALTNCLLEQLSHLDAVELDRDLVVLLRDTYTPDRLTVHAADALFFNYAALSKKSHDLRIVGNLPYNISTPLLFHLFSQQESIRDMHFMLQKEVVLRLTAQVGTDDYSRLSVMSQYFCDNTYLFTVSPHAFNPPPKVDSAIVRLIPKQTLSLEPAAFERFSSIVKEAFNYRRKKLSNALKKLVTPDQFDRANIDANARPQDLSVEDYVRLALQIA